MQLADLLVVLSVQVIVTIPVCPVDGARYVVEEPVVGLTDPTSSMDSEPPSLVP